ncbi:MAG: ribose 1,5-bisphosphate isomerase [Methanocellales archaeon]
MDPLLEIARKIKSMEIRGASVIARTAAEALAQRALSLKTASFEEFNEEMKKAARILIQTRPTAVSLPNAVRFVMNYKSRTVEEARREIVSNAAQFIERSEKAVERIGEIGAQRLRDGDVIMTHCNSTAALAIIITAFKQGKHIEVIATESRPRWQGHLTAKQLNEAGIPTTLIVDSAVRYFMKEVDLVCVGADAIGVNGAVINKIGTSQLALAAHEARVSVIVAAETYKFSPRTVLGELVEIEERPSEEVLDLGILASLRNVKVRNPAFDVTPKEYVDLIVTEVGVFPPELAYLVIKEYLGWTMEEMELDLGRHRRRFNEDL